MPSSKICIQQMPPKEKKSKKKQIPFLQVVHVDNQEMPSSPQVKREISHGQMQLSEKYALNYGIKELKSLCKQNGIKGYSKMNKSEMAALFANNS